VHITYGRGAASALATVNSRGEFTGHIQANALLPSTNTVTARDGNKSASATYQQTF
jgi:hypothetical protein